jgi:hypothetical protein
MAADRGDALPAWARLLSPSAVFAGVAVSFVGCCLAGYLASRYNPFRNVERFHALLTPESQFYPTASQVRQMLRSLLGPDDVAVLVSGSSHMHGSGQTAPGLWTRRLQDELGPRFKVINLALRGGSAVELGCTAAEMICREHPRLIVVTEAWAGTIVGQPDGSAYRYFYWDAYYKRRLLPDPERELWLRGSVHDEDARERAAGQLTGGYAELRRRMRLDSKLYFTDLWNRVAYDYLFTVWTPHSQHPFTRPRRSLDDTEPGPLPLARRFPTPRMAQDLSILRGLFIHDTPARDETSARLDDPQSPRWITYRRLLRALFPAPLRDRLVVLVSSHSRYHREQLPSAEQAEYSQVCRGTVRATEAEGVAALAEEYEGLAEEDYADLQHLSPSGGAKVAVRVAAKVRERARALGYIP